MAGPIRLHPDNPARLDWQGRGVFLLGSTEHYGALLNAAFDYERYLDTIAADRLNVTQVFAFFRELEDVLGGQIGYANTVAPRPEHYLAPWARATGAAARDLGPDGLPRFDLDTWDERYFTRLRAFLSAAAARNVVVEVDLFVNLFDASRWRQLPLHPGSNINGVGAGLAGAEEFRLYADPSVIEHERRLIRKLVAEANAFDNVYYEICGEPSCTQDGVPRPDLVRDWHRLMVETVRETERGLPKRHLVAVNAHQQVEARPAVAGEVRVGLLDDGYYLRDPQVDLLNIHYISHRLPREGLNHAYPGGARPRAAAYRPGNMATFMALRSPAGKAIGFNEDWNGVVHRQTPRPVQARLEAWESLLAGCATYQHLDYSFTTDDPTGAAAGAIPAALPPEWFDGRALRRELSHVAAYAATLELETLRPDLLAVCQAPLHVGTVAAHADRGGQEVLALYLADVRRPEEGFGTSSLAGAVTLEGLSPTSPYTVRALDPQTGAWSSLPPVTADPWGEVRLEVPPFREDTLVELTRAGKS